MSSINTAKHVLQLYTCLYIYNNVPFSLDTTKLKPTIKQLSDALSDKVDWYELGIQLDITPATLSTVTEGQHTAKRRLVVMLEKWQNKYPQKGWSDIITALREMDRNDLADQVANKHCKLVLDALLTAANLLYTCSHHSNTGTL